MEGLAHLFNTPPIVPIQRISGSQQCLPDRFTRSNGRPENDCRCLSQHSSSRCTSGTACHDFSWDSNDGVSGQQKIPLKACIGAPKALHNAHRLVSIKRDLLLGIVIHSFLIPTVMARVWSQQSLPILKHSLCPNCQFGSQSHQLFRCSLCKS